MPSGLTRKITSLLFLMFSLQIVGAAATVLPSTSDRTLFIRANNRTSCIINSFLLDLIKDGVEKTLEPEDEIDRVLLHDFSIIAASLSGYHTPQYVTAPEAYLYDVRPPLHQVNCVFLI